jgi:predicted acylesterase/phospholipase RssA
MGKVVKLERDGSPRPRERATGTRRTTARRRSSRPVRPSKTALVLGGGGFTGGVYEIGALRALDLLSVNRTVNQFDVYVGTSAGSFVASLMANGITPEEMMLVINQQVPTPFRDIDLGALLRPNFGEFARKGVMLPWRALGLARSLVGQLGAVSAMDVVLGLAEALPSGFYSGTGIEEYVRTVLTDPERTDDFRELRRELYLAATDLDSCEQIVFGREGWDDVPISTAVAASTALPMVYKPVRVRDRELVDGGVLSTTNLDIAVEAGAGLIVVINPLVPYVNDSSERHVSDMGFPHVGYQAFKLLTHQRLHEMAKLWKDRYPDVDIVLIEPDADDELMFQTSIMNYTSRIEIARHGFASVTRKLAKDYESYREIAERHGIQISATRLRKVVEQVVAEPEKTHAWRRIFEQTTGSLLRQTADDAG